MREELTAMLPVLRRFCHSLTGSVADADDLLQSTCERLLNRDVPPDADLQRWAFRVCRNLWIDEYRARRTRRNLAADPELAESVTIDGEREIHARLELDRVSSAMRRLPEEQHLVLSMVAVQGLSYKGVAEALGIPIGTVMSRVARARTNLLQLMQHPIQENCNEAIH